MSNLTDLDFISVDVLSFLFKIGFPDRVGRGYCIENLMYLIVNRGTVLLCSTQASRAKWGVVDAEGIALPLSLPSTPLHGKQGDANTPNERSDAYHNKLTSGFKNYTIYFN